MHYNIDGLYQYVIVSLFVLDRKGRRLINSVFRLSSTLRIPLPIPLVKLKELRCNSLSYENTSKNFNSILNDKSSADIVFICGENQYYCHKIIICSRVQLFRELFGLCLNHDNMSVTFTSNNLSLNAEALKVTSLFEEVRIVDSSHHW